MGLLIFTWVLVAMVASIHISAINDNILSPFRMLLIQINLKDKIEIDQKIGELKETIYSIKNTEDEVNALKAIRKLKWQKYKLHLIEKPIVSCPFCMPTLWWMPAYLLYSLAGFPHLLIGEIIIAYLSSVFLLYLIFKYINKE